MIEQVQPRDVVRLDHAGQVHVAVGAQQEGNVPLQPVEEPARQPGGKPRLGGEQLLERAARPARGLDIGPVGG